MRQSVLRVIGIFLVVFSSSIVQAAPDVTMTIVPTATSGTTITAADENSRSNAASTVYNSHDHNDIDQTANTLNVGDGTAGTKSICGNAADATDSCLRWNDTANIWQIDVPSASTFNQITTATGTAGLTSNALLIGGGGGIIDDTTIIVGSTLPANFGDYSARVYNDSAISISSGTATILTFNQERWDTDTIHSTASNTGRLTATTAGKYQLICHAEWAGNGGGYRRLELRLNGATIIASEDGTPSSQFPATTFRQTVTTHYNLAATNYVECLANQTGDTILNVNSSSNYSPEFEMVKVP